jgi:hypothetical protein
MSCWHSGGTVFPTAQERRVILRRRNNSVAVGRIVAVYADVLQQARDLVLHEQLATL